MFRIFLTNLGKYNEGELVGEWVDLPISDDELNDVLNRIGIDYEEYEETFISDYETDFDYAVDEYDDISELNEVADTLESFNILDNIDIDIINSILDYASNFDEAVAILEDKDFIYYPNCNDMSDVAFSFADETGMLDDIPPALQEYFDFEKYGEFMDSNGYFVECGTGYLEIYG